VRSERHFQSFLGPEIERFLAHKRSLRRRYAVEETTLALLDAYLSKNKIGSLAEVTPALVDEFMLSRPRMRPRSYNHLRCTVGRLFSYLVDHGKLAETPLRSPPRRARYQRAPFIFDTDAAKRLLTLAKALPSTGSTTERGSTYFVLFAVLYGLGLRVGEACRLRLLCLPRHARTRDAGDLSASCDDPRQAHITPRHASPRAGGINCPVSFADRAIARSATARCCSSFTTRALGCRRLPISVSNILSSNHRPKSICTAGVTSGAHARSGMRR
jgi:hypothetical protein